VRNGTPGDAVRVAEELLSREKVEFLIGTFPSNVGLAVADFAKQRKVLFIAAEPLTDKIVWDNGNRYTFRLRPSTYMQTAMLIPDAAKLKKKRWAIVYPNYEYGQSATRWFKELLDPTTDLGERFLASLGRNLFFSAVILAIEVPLGIVVALSMPREGWRVAAFLVIMALPLLIPWNVVGTIWQIFGRPDIGLTTLTEVAETVGNIRDRVALPLIVDGDNGFGNALNVQRTVRLLEKMGASAIQLEDQTLPKRCGHLDGKTLVSVGEMLGKLKAAQDARVDPATVLVARTDAIAVDGFEAGMERAHAYAEAGADVLFIEALRSLEQFERAGRELGGRIPLLANMVEGGKTPLLSIGELGALGFRLAIHPGAMVRVVGQAATNYLATLRSEGTTRGMLDRMFDFQQLNAVIGTDDMLRRGERYREL